jgi:hypothetical protein
MNIRRHLYLNIYEHAGGFTISHYHETRAEADEAAKHRDDRISCLRIEFTEGQHDPDEGFYLNINEFGETYTLSQVLYGNRKEADNAHTRSSKRVACVRVPLVRGRFDP